MTTQHRTREQTPRLGWPVPAALVALSAIPLIVGALRLLQLAGGPELIPAEERFAGFPLAVALHILGAATYVLIGTLQFVPRFRRRHRIWHRRAGRILIVAGLLVAASALWMTLLYAAKPGTGELLYVLRLVFGSALVACLVLGFTAIRRRNIPAHRAWMIRAYAIALAAGTQAFTQGLGGALFGTGQLQGDLAQGAGWVINLAIAEWVIRRPTRIRRGRGQVARPTRPSATTVGHADDRRQHSSCVLTCLACPHDEYPPFRLDQGPYDTSFDLAHPLASAYAQLLDQRQRP